METFADQETLGNTDVTVKDQVQAVCESMKAFFSQIEKVCNSINEADAVSTKKSLHGILSSICQCQETPTDHTMASVPQNTLDESGTHVEQLKLFGASMPESSGSRETILKGAEFIGAIVTAARAWKSWSSISSSSNGADDSNESEDALFKKVVFATESLASISCLASDAKSGVESLDAPDLTPLQADVLVNVANMLLTHGKSQVDKWISEKAR